jgi:hypothetical protein
MVLVIAILEGGIIVSLVVQNLIWRELMELGVFLCGSWSGGMPRRVFALDWLLLLKNLLLYGPLIVKENLAVGVITTHHFLRFIPGVSHRFLGVVDINRYIFTIIGLFLACIS